MCSNRLEASRDILVAPRGFRTQKGACDVLATRNCNYLRAQGPDLGAAEQAWYRNEAVVPVGKTQAIQLTRIRGRTF
jgi:hypothetical protein